MIIQASATEYARVAFVGRVAGQVIDPTQHVVELAFVGVNAEPVPGDWNVGDWETDNSPPLGSVYYGRVLLGPAEVVLPVGTYSVWIKVERAPETIIRRARGTLTIQ
jgi:hypothetical protein